jgi:hypothetical protein
VRIICHVKHGRHLYAPGISFGARCLVDKNGELVVDLLGEFCVHLAPEDRASTGVWVYQGNIVGA